MKNYRQFLGLGLLLLLIQSPVLQAQEETLLPPEEAFSLNAWVEGDTLVAEYQIAPGYYMYRERFSFQIESSDTPARFDVAIIPDGKVKHDEFFGEMETYRDSVKIKLPILFDGTTASRLQVKMTSQGCADIGVCYPPLKQALAVELASNARIMPTAWTANKTPVESTGEDVVALQALLDEVSSNLENTQQSSQTEAANDGDALAVLDRKSVV
jgi:thiol:disulfide interchange protein DsbD